MAIRDIKITHPEAGGGFPVVSWEEDRPLLHGGPVQHICYIRPDEATGVLLFCQRGSDGSSEPGRPWELLRSFHVAQWEALHGNPQMQAAKQLIVRRSKSAFAEMLALDGTLTIAAQFGDERPLIASYLNRANATRAEMDELHDHLYREFRILRDAKDGYIDRLCAERFRWRSDTEGKPLPYTPPALPAMRSGRMGWWEPILALCIVAAVVYAALHGFWRY
ncbi:MAG: hypothetical protein JSS20_14230 [Proteobacteria bacterium]|nr:hypothetical protein [Pseudomonadota bacterium]